MLSILRWNNLFHLNYAIRIPRLPNLLPALDGTRLPLADSGSRPGLKPDTGKSGNALTAGRSRAVSIWLSLNYCNENDIPDQVKLARFDLPICTTLSKPKKNRKCLQ